MHDLSGYKRARLLILSEGSTGASTLEPLLCLLNQINCTMFVFVRQMHNYTPHNVDDIICDQNICYARCNVLFVT